MKLYMVLSGFVILVLLSGGCASYTKTKTETIIKIDTLIKFIPDTVFMTVSGTVFDTVTIENEQAIARAFYNVKTSKLDLQLKGKIFEMPVQIRQKVKTKEIVKEPKKHSLSFFILGLLTTLSIIIIVDKYKSFKK